MQIHRHSPPHSFEIRREAPPWCLFCVSYGVSDGGAPAISPIFSGIIVLSVKKALTGAVTNKNANIEP